MFVLKLNLRLYLNFLNENPGSATATECMVHDILFLLVSWQCQEL